MILKLSEVSKDFGGITAAKDVSFAIPQGSIMGLIGPNGAGKTTIFNLITGTFPPVKGTISLNGISLAGKKPFERAKARITRTFQNLQLFSGMTVLENVMTGAYLQGRKGFITSLFTRPAHSREEKESVRIPWHFWMKSA
jgi:branched-chain amino acid transport system ATP-binding protein